MGVCVGGATLAFLLIPALPCPSLGLVLYNIPLLINQYIGNNTTKHHSRSMSDNRDLTGVFHQKISLLPEAIASDSRYFQSSRICSKCY